MAHSRVSVPSDFIWRRIHSLVGLGLVLFLFEHLLTNSQAALLLGGNGNGFVCMVNRLHHLPYLHLVEIFLIGIPLLIHLAWGVRYWLTGKFNAIPGLKKSPSLATYARNQGYMWMRITAVIIGVGVVLHVVQFRFLRYPITYYQGGKTLYLTPVSGDKGLKDLSQCLGVELYDEDVKQFAGVSVKPGQVIAVSPDFGTATLLVVRDVFKSPLMAAFYSIFVLATCFHAGNGFWTFLITWGAIIRKVAQDRMYRVAFGLVIVLALMGLAAIWGTYLSNLTG